MNQDNRPPRRGMGQSLLGCALAVGLLLGGVDYAAAVAQPKEKVSLKPKFKMQKAKVIPRKKSDGAAESEDSDHTRVRLTPKLKKTEAERPEPAAESTVTPDDVAISKPAPKTPDDGEQARLTAARKAEEERLAQLKAERLAEEKRLAEAKAKAAEAERLAARKAEEDRLAQLKAEREAEERRLAEAKKKTEEAERLAARKAEDDRLAHAKAVAEMREEKKKDEEPARATKKTAERQSASTRRPRKMAEVEDEVKTEAIEVAKATKSSSKEPSESAMKTALVAAPSPEARLRLEQLVTQTKDRAMLHALAVRLGDVDMALGDAASAETAYQVAMNAAPNAEASRAAGEKLAVAATGHGNFQAASRQWATLRMTGGSSDPRMLNAEALTLAAACDYANAEKIWAEFETAAASAKPEVKADALLGQALTAELKGQRDKAQQMLRRVTAEFASTPQAALAQKRLSDLKEPVIP